MANPALLVCDADLIKSVLSDTKYFRRSEIGEVHCNISDSSLIKINQKLNQFLIRKHSSTINSLAGKLNDELNKEQTVRFSFALLAQCLFGVNVSSITANHD